MIVTVDLERVFIHIEARDQARREIDAAIQSYKTRFEEHHAERVRLGEDLDMLVPGTEMFDQALKQYRQSARDEQAMSEFVDFKRDEMKGEARRELFYQIRNAASEYAQANGIDVIITDDAQLPIQGGTDIQIIQQLTLRRVVYVDTAYDITDGLIAWINAP